MPKLRAAAVALLTVAGCYASMAQTAGQDVTISTDKGPVAGRVATEVQAFLGIPYAAPPVGELRFRAPAPHPPWAEPLQANTFGSACPQSARLRSPSTNEDCLFLNIWAPTRGTRHPVLVFIHGGSFNAGSGGAVPGGPSYAGADIVAKSGAVVVTINYRLSVLGYLAAEALDAENPDHVSGNYGLQDQQAALSWVHRNIESFGGDPANVTLFGESAGGISVLYQLVSPAASGLFQRAIVESANDGTSLPRADAERREVPLIKSLGCDPADLTCLRHLPVETIVNSGLSVGPAIDGHTVPQQPVAAFAAGQFNHVPVIIGTNTNEGTYFLDVAALSVQHALTPADYDAVIAGNYTQEAASQIKAAYPVDSYPTPGQALSAITTDSFFACPSDAVRAALTGNASVFGYEFTQPDPVTNFPLPTPLGISLGQAHTTELAYVFGHDGAGAPLSGHDLTLSDTMIGFWTSFAATGNPNNDRQEGQGANHPVWPAYQTETPNLIKLGTPIAVTAAFATDHRCAFWKSLGYPEKLPVSVPKPAP
jgi:para-nitrobenzyl esterase